MTDGDGYSGGHCDGDRDDDGNAGNNSTTFTFDPPGGSTVTCNYKGGADVSNPVGNPGQIAKGMRYVFDTCSDGTLAGATFSAEAVTLRVNNGAAQLPAGNPETTIEMTLVYVP